MPKAFMGGCELAVDIASFPMLVEASLSRLGCRDFKYNKAYRQITAKDLERYPGRNNWAVEYEILIRYALKDNGALDYEISVTDSRNEWSEQFCQMRLAAIVKALGEDALVVPEASNPSTAYGSARWATEKDLRDAGYISSQPGSNRLLIALWERKELIAISREQTNWHALVCGPTGAGKSSGFFIPNLLFRTGSSAIVTEATAGFEAPELYTKTAGWRAKKGHKIYFFNPSDMTSTRINPLDSVSTGPMHQQTALAEGLADLVILNTSPPGAQRGDPIWDKNEKSLLTTLILHMVAKDPEQAHFGSIRKMLAGSEKTLRQELAKSQSGYAAENFEAFMSHSSENFRHGVFAGLMSRLNPWASEQIVRLTSKTDLDAEQLKDELFTFYFSVPSRKAGMKPIAALTFNYLLDLALDMQFSKPLNLVLDEFTNFGYIPGIDEALSIIRRREISCMLGIQDYRQLESVYSRDKAGIIITQVGTRVFFRPRDFKTAKEVSDGLGYQTILDSKFTDRGSVMEREMGRPLMTASELMEIKPDKVLVMTPSTPPILCTRFTHATFPVPPGYPAPERKEHPALAEYSEVRKAKDVSEGSDARSMDQEAEVDKLEDAELAEVAETELKRDNRRKNKPKKEEEPEHEVETSQKVKSTWDIDEQDVYLP